MTLLLERNTLEAAVEADLQAIAVDDGPNLGDDGGSPVQISYTQTMSGFGQDRLNALVNGDFASPVWILGGDDTFVLSDGTLITSVAGVCYPSSLLIVYDTSQCGGRGYFVFDNQGSRIPFPGFVILFHELAHAYHWAVGDSDAAHPEIQAETDENELRTQYGMPLRDPNNHGGGCGRD